MNRILIISPVRNEAEFIEQTLKSMVAQEHRPEKWLIIDDGSSDATYEIVESYSSKYNWIELVKKPDRGTRAVGPGVVETFNYGLSKANLNDFDFVCKLDGDISFLPSYFKELLSKFESDPKLGAASGKPYIYHGNGIIPERTNDEMVAGQMNFYKRECFAAIGGFVQQVHWDGIAFHKARMAGWKTRSYDEPALRFMHLRLMGSSYKSIFTGRLRWGKGQYFLGTHPLYILAIGAYRAMEKPFVVGGILIVIGYIRSALLREDRFEFPGFRRSLHAWQMERLGLGKRLEDI